MIVDRVALMRRQSACTMSELRLSASYEVGVVWVGR